MAQDGIIPKPTKPGQYDLYECTQRYIDYLKNKATNKSKIDDEIKQIKKARLQLELEKERGLYILKSDIVAELIKRIVVLKRDFKALENRLSKYPTAKEIVKRAHLSMMTTYSKKTGPFHERGHHEKKP